MKTFRNYLLYITLLGPVVESYAVFLAMKREMDWNVIFVIIAAVLVAGTGFWGVQVMNSMAEFNATMKSGETKEKWTLPTWKSMIVLAIWFTGVTLLTIFLDVWPALKDWTPLGLVVIGFSASYLFSLSNLHATREEERIAHRQNKKQESTTARNQRKEERKSAQEQAKKIAKKREEVKQVLQAKGIRSHPRGGKLTDEVLLYSWELDPFLTPTEMANRLMEEGVVETITRQAIKSRRDAMVKKGLIVLNDDGRVVLYNEVGQGSGVEVESDTVES